MYLPEAFQKKMKAILGEEYDDFLAGFEKPRHYGLRVNTAKITVEEFKELVPFHLTQIPWVENGFYYEEEDAPTRHPYYYAGLYYIQEPSAMTTASRLPVGPGEAAKPRSWGQNCLGKDFWWQMTSVLRG